LYFSNQNGISDTTIKTYESQGFVIIRQLISEDVLSPFNYAYQKEVVPSKHKLYRQNSNQYERNRITDSGYVEQSFFDVLGYPHFPNFKSSALNLLFNENLLSALNNINGHTKHNLMQTALFDANTATTAHQDWWYADSVPSGHMIGAWIALEDIAEESGRFYVVAGSHKVILHESNMRHSEWQSKLNDYVKAKSECLVAPALKKGDVLFFNAGIIHGALPTKEPKYSRKSLVGHYMPSHMTYGNLFGAKPWVQYHTHEGKHLYHINKPPYSLKSELITKFRSIVYDKPPIMQWVRKLQNKSMADF